MVTSFMFDILNLLNLIHFWMECADHWINSGFVLIIVDVILVEILCDSTYFINLCMIIIIITI